MCRPLGNLPAPPRHTLRVGGVKVFSKKIGHRRAASPAFLEARTLAAGLRLKLPEAFELRRVVPDIFKRLFSQIAAAKKSVLHESAGENAAAGVDAAGHLAGAAHIQPQVPPPILGYRKEGIAGKDIRLAGEPGGKFF